MDWLIDWLRDVLGWVIAAVASWAIYVTTRLHKQSERIAVLERNVTDLIANLPSTNAALRAQLLADTVEIKAEFAILRSEAKERSKDLYKHIDDVRLELKQDIRDERTRRN